MLELNISKINASIIFGASMYQTCSQSTRHSTILWYKSGQRSLIIFSGNEKFKRTLKCIFCIIYFILLLTWSKPKKMFWSRFVQPKFFIILRKFDTNANEPQWNELREHQILRTHWIIFRKKWDFHVVFTYIFQMRMIFISVSSTLFLFLFLYFTNHLLNKYMIKIYFFVIASIHDNFQDFFIWNFKTATDFRKNDLGSSSFYLLITFNIGKWL